MTLAHVEKAALSLPPLKRAKLVDDLLLSLNGPASPEIEKAWADEAEARIDAFDASRGKAGPAAAGSVRYSGSNGIAPTAVRRLFLRNGMNDWYTVADVRYYLAHAVCVASAWSDKSCVGVAVLVGMPGLNVELDILLVDASHRGKGIGTHLLGMIIDAARESKPYHFKVEVYEKRTQRFYMRSGFVPNEGTWLLEHAKTAERLRHKVSTVRRGNLARAT